MSTASAIAKKIGLVDLIKVPTETKPDSNHLHSIGLNTFNFTDDYDDDAIFDDKYDFVEELTQPPSPSAEPVKEINPDYDAEKNATALVNMLHAIDSMLLSGAVLVRCRHKAGGGKQLKKMKAAITKQLNGDEISDQDKMLIQKFQEYKNDLQMLSGEVLPGQEQIDNMIKMAIPYCEATQMEIGAGAAFWLTYAGGLVGRITKILAP